MVTFRCYDPTYSGTGGIHLSYRTQRQEICAEIDGALELLGPEKDFDEIEIVKPLRGKCSGLTEIKIDFCLDGNDVHIRILGCEWSGQGGIYATYPVREKRWPGLWASMSIRS